MDGIGLALGLSVAVIVVILFVTSKTYFEPVIAFILLVRSIFQLYRIKRLLVFIRSLRLVKQHTFDIFHFRELPRQLERDKKQERFFGGAGGFYYGSSLFLFGTVFGDDSIWRF